MMQLRFFVPVGSTMRLCAAWCFFMYILSGCQAQPATPTAPDAHFPYDLATPSHVINLASEALQEISGLSPTDTDGIFLGIADEKGTIYFIDGNGGGAIVRQVEFRDKGDFEGVEWADKCLYAVKSDGKIFEIRNWKNGDPKVREFETPLSKENDVEGLCYDPGRKALLVAEKGNPDVNTPRNIYAFNLKTNELEAAPVYVINPVEINQILPSTPGIEKDNYFSPSGIAIHPLTREVYVVSSAKKRLAVLDYTTGKVLTVIRLDKKMLPQPEGISFDSKGNLYLSSEGKSGEGLLYRFDLKEKK